MIERRIHDVEIKPAPAVSPGTTAKKAARLLREGNTPAVVIRDEIVMGIITESDIVTTVAETDTMLNSESVMPTPVPPVSPDTTLLKAAERMRSNGVRWLPVVNGTEYCGVVSVDTLAPYLSRHRLRIKEARTRTAAEANDTVKIQISD